MSYVLKAAWIIFIMLYISYDSQIILTVYLIYN